MRFVVQYTMDTDNYCYINDPEVATQAAKWCKRNRIKYDIEYWGWPGKTNYKFIFNNNKQMMLFALKWK